MIVYDREGNAVDIPDEKATAAIASGAYGLPAGSMVPIHTEEGIKSVPIEQAHRHIADGGTIATAAEVRRADVDARYGGIAGGLEAAGEGALSGATLGLSDAAISALSPEARQRMADVREAHPWVRTGAELAGSVAPALLTGGSSEAVTAGVDAAEHAGQVGQLLRGAGRVLAAPTEAAGAVGSAFERGVGAIVGDEGTSLAGRIAQSGSKAAARGAGEGAAFGGGQELSEQSLGPAPLNGEKLLAAVGHGALLGGLGGGALGATGELTTEALGRSARRLGAAAEDRAASAVGLQGDRSVGRELLSRDLVRPGDTAGDVVARVTAERRTVGREMQGLLEQADAASVAGPAVSSVRTKLADAIDKIEPLGGQAAVAPLRAVASDLSGAPRLTELLGGALPAEAPTHLDFASASRALDRLDAATEGAVAHAIPPATVKALRDVRASLLEEVQRAGSAASKALGPEWGESYAKAAESYRRLSVAEQAASIGSKSPASAFGASRIAGSLMAVMHGANPMSVALSAAGALGHHYVEQRGAATAAAVLDRVSQLGAVRRAAALVDRRIEAATSTLARKGGRAPALHDPVGTYEDARRAVVDAAQDMSAHRGVLATAATPISTHAPETAKAFQAAASRATSYLASQLPSHPMPHSLLPQKAAAFEPSPFEQASFLRKVQAVHDPVSLLTRAHDGTLTGEEVSAVESTHPELLQEMRSKTTAALAKISPGEVLSDSEKTSLSTLLGQPVDTTCTPAFASAIAEAYASSPQPKPSPTGSKPRGGTKRVLKSAKESHFSTDLDT